MLKQIILFNGAPNSGKDALAMRLVECIKNIEYMQFKSHLYNATANFMGIDVDTFKDLYELYDEKLGRFKELDIFNINGKTISIRSAMKYVAEEVIKPTYGDDYYANKVCESLSKTNSDTVIINDCGFNVEVETIRKHYPDTLIKLIRVERDGCDFDDDSRYYITKELCESLNIQIFYLHNKEGKLSSSVSNSINIINKH